MMASVLLALCLFSTLAMVGLIWFVQIVHYPMFRNVGENEFKAYMELHQKLTFFVVGPFMLMEAFSSVALLYWQPPQTDTRLLWIAVGLVLAIWLSTAFLQVPRHGVLAKHGYLENHHTALISTNWLRTAAWSARGVILVVLMAQMSAA